MKNPWIIVSAALLLCGIGAGMRWQAAATRVAALEAQAGQLTADNARLNKDLTEATQKAETLEEESAQLRAARAMSSGRLEPAAPAPAATPEEGQGYLAKMFKDPDVLKIMQREQAAALRTLYADFLKETYLSPDQTDRFFQILQDRQMALMDASQKAMSGGTVDEKGAMAATDAASDALRQLLGPDQFARYEQYEKTLGPRLQVAQFSRQLASLGMPLQDYQTTALVQIFSQESVSPPTQTGGAQPEKGVDAGGIDQFSQDVDTANQRIYQRARPLLTREQLGVLSSFQKNMAETQVAGLRMARQMMNGE